MKHPRYYYVCPYCREQVNSDYHDSWDFQDTVDHDHGGGYIRAVRCLVGEDEAEVERVHAERWDTWQREIAEAEARRQKSQEWWSAFYALPEEERLEKYGYRSHGEMVEKSLREAFTGTTLQEALYQNDPLLEKAGLR